MPRVNLIWRCVPWPCHVIIVATPERIFSKYHRVDRSQSNAWNYLVKLSLWDAVAHLPQISLFFFGNIEEVALAHRSLSRLPPASRRRRRLWLYNTRRRDTASQRGRLCMRNARKSREMIIRLQIEERFEINQATGEPWRTCRSENNYFNSISADAIHIASQCRLVVGSGRYIVPKKFLHRQKIARI